MVGNGQAVKPLLDVQELKTAFFMRRGVVKAVNGVSFTVMSGETLGLLGESGSGKTMTVTSILRLLPKGARILSGDVLFEGENLLTKTEKDMAAVRGKRIGLLLQNSMAALDPVFTIGTQVANPGKFESKRNSADKRVSTPWREVVKGNRIQHVSDTWNFTSSALRKWVHRFDREGVAGLSDRPRSDRPAN